MILVIDAGNSNLTLAAFDGTGKPTRPLKTWRLSTHPVGTADELRGRIHSVMAPDGHRLQDFGAVVLASVVPAVTERVRSAFPKAHVIDHTWPYSFRIGNENPAQTGIDRLVNAESVVRELGVPAIIVDAGTATTLCAISKERVFLGGAILPGLESCRDALPARAAQLFRVELAAPPQAIGRNTTHALQSGIVLGYASMIDGLIARFREELAQTGSDQPRVVATGGLSWLLRDTCKEIGAVDPDLTLKGILYLYESVRAR